jgi:hypothetical protein
MKTARDERAEEIEAEDEGFVGETGVERAGGLEESQMCGYAGVGEGRDVGSPTEFVAKPVHAGARRTVAKMGRIRGAAEGVEAADAEITAGDENGMARTAPIVLRNRGGEWTKVGQPVGRNGFVEGAAGTEGKWNEIAAVATEDRRALERALAGEERGVRGRGIPQRGEATGGCETGGRVDERSSHGGRSETGKVRRRPIRSGGETGGIGAFADESGERLDAGEGGTGFLAVADLNAEVLFETNDKFQSIDGIQVQPGTDEWFVVSDFGRRDAFEFEGFDDESF